jgi:carbamoyl-phosphate synthase large subunit
MIKILVTGAGALLGQGIIRCLKMIRDMDIFIISADPSAKSTGHFIADKSYLIPFAVDENYIQKIEDIIEQEKIDVIFVGTDTELPKLSINKEFLETKYGVKVIVSNNHVIEIANDKWKTSEFLKENQFPYPLSALTNDYQSIQRLIELNEFPYIAKPIDGARSQGIQIINNKDQLLSLCDYKNNLVVQELIGKDNEEYTSGCLVIDGKCKSIITLRRDLRDGNTWRAYRNGNNPYDQMIKDIAEKLKPDGPVNFQFRIKNDFPIIFEINGRFSGTTPLRAMFGFNEVEALMKYYFFDKEIEQPLLKDGIVMRTFSDLFVENITIDELSINKVLSKPDSIYFPFKIIK